MGGWPGLQRRRASSVSALTSRATPPRIRREPGQDGAGRQHAGRLSVWRVVSAVRPQAPLPTAVMKVPAPMSAADITEAGPRAIRCRKMWASAGPRRLATPLRRSLERLLPRSPSC